MPGNGYCKVKRNEGTKTRTGVSRGTARQGRLSRVCSRSSTGQGEFQMSEHQCV